MLKKSIFGLLFVAFLTNNVMANTLLQGQVYVNKPVSHSLVTIRDVNNKVLTTTTDDKGFYQQDISKLVEPIVVFSNYNLLGRTVSGDQICTGNCMVSLTSLLQKDKVNIVNINPFSDFLVSNVAKQISLIGPEQFIEKGLSARIDDAMLVKAYQQFHLLFDKSLQQVGITDPLFSPINSSDPKLNNLLDLIIFNRGYDSTSGQIGATVLLDMRFKPISEQSPFDYVQALTQKKDNIEAKQRIFILGDSTASNYDAKVYPRMGWGQVFDQFLDSKADIVVINAAQSGRSSRSFYAEGWLNLMTPFMQKGDYMIIAFGHNDEKCDSSNAKRGKADIDNLCTYPNDANNHKQYPANSKYMSFQTSLERYVHIAKDKEMIPILMTPVTRFRDVNNKIAYQNQTNDPVSHMHYTKNKPGFAYWGNYSNTVKHTAQVNQVSFIDLESLSIDFANKHKEDWQSYWLVVDPNDARYKYYKTQSSGVLDHPDTTHFQEKGAVAIANIIAKAIKNDPKLRQGIAFDPHKIN